MSISSAESLMSLMGASRPPSEDRDPGGIRIRPMGVNEHASTIEKRENKQTSLLS